MPRTNDIREKLQEKGHQQQTDMHPVHIGIGRNDNLVVTQVIHILLNVECSLQQIELFILVNDLLVSP